jgi:hypothetical protein
MLRAINSMQWGDATGRCYVSAAGNDAGNRIAVASGAGFGQEQGTKEAPTPRGCEGWWNNSRWRCIEFPQ